MSKTLLLCSSTDESTKADWLPSNAPSRYKWLATVSPSAKSGWEAFFAGLLEDDEPNASCWFGLNQRGRSFGSGLGAPDLLTLFGRSLRPVELISPSDSSTSSSASLSPSETKVLEKQKQFYQHLTSGDLQSMTEMFSSSRSEAVQGVVDAGGSLDSWKLNLQAGARPEVRSNED